MSDTEQKQPIASQPVQKITLVQVDFMSCYFKGSTRLKLPSRMAWCTPRMKVAMEALRAELQGLGGDLILSDLYRSSDMQTAAHRRYMSARAEWEAKGRIGNPPKFSPPSGFSGHEAGEAMDIDLRALLPIAKGVMSQVLDVFWPIAKKHGFRPVIKQPNEGQNESWHFDLWDEEKQKIYNDNQPNGYKTVMATMIARRVQPY